MGASVIKCHFAVVGESRDEVIEKIEELTLDFLSKAGGEPWLITSDDMNKLVTDEKAFLTGNPAGAYYQGSRTLFFAGPNVVAQTPGFRDGFRPQDPDSSL